MILSPSKRPQQFTELFSEYINHMVYPWRSPGLNPVEHHWEILDFALYHHHLRKINWKKCSSIRYSPWEFSEFQSVLIYCNWHIIIWFCPATYWCNKWDFIFIQCKRIFIMSQCNSNIFCLYLHSPFSWLYFFLSISHTSSGSSRKVDMK